MIITIACLLLATLLTLLFSFLMFASADHKHHDRDKTDAGAQQKEDDAQEDLFHYVSPTPVTVHHGGQKGVRLRYRLVGRESAPRKVLFIVGLATNFGWWIPQIRHLQESKLLQEQVQICVYDNRGAGRSDTPRGVLSCSVMQMAEDALQLLRHLRWKRPHVVGMSMGGLIAQTLAHKLDKAQGIELQSLVLISTFTWLWSGRHSLPMPTALHMLFKASIPTLPQRKRVDTILDTMFSSEWLSAPFQPVHHAPSSATKTITATRALTNRDMCHKVYGFMFGKREMSIRGTTKQVVGILTHCFPAHRLSKIARRWDGSHLPVLVIGGTGDRMVNHHNSYALHRHLSEASKYVRLEMFEGCGHIVTVECADEANRLLFDDWLHTHHHN